jgi:hypothetical protein
MSVRNSIGAPRLLARAAHDADRDRARSGHTLKSRLTIERALKGNAQCKAQ